MCSSDLQILNDMKLNVPGGRFENRRALLPSLDELKRQAERSGVVESAGRFEQQAFDVILGGITNAFNVSKEDPRLLEQYATSMFTIPKACQKRKRTERPFPALRPRPSAGRCCWRAACAI